MTGTQYQYDEYNNNKFKDKNDRKSFLSLLPSIQINEWTFSLCLFLLSSAIVIGKIYTNYGQFLLHNKNNGILLSSTSNLESVLGLLMLPNEFISNIINNVEEYRWFIKAVLSGIATTGLTWYIIYKDSNIPGVNPPSPLSPKKKMYPMTDDSKVPLNYLIGIVNGIIIFIYMCL